MTDAHLHLQNPKLDGIRDDVIATMRQAGITRCVVNGTSPDDWPAVAQLAKDYPDLIIPSFGLHPWKQPTDDWYQELLYWLDHTPHACIGECGLDRWIDGYDMDLQTSIFTAQLDLATTRNLPLSIHCLKAWGALIDLLESRPLPKRRFLLHSYAGSAELVPRLTKLEAYFSFSGYFLHERKKSVRDVFQTVPPERLLMETDAPDMLPPQQHIAYPLKESINHPANLPTIVQAASKFLDVTQVEQNFDTFFVR